MPRPRVQFDLRTVFSVIALIAIGLGSLKIAVNQHPYSYSMRGLVFLLLLVAGASFGSAIGLPFRRGVAGAIIGGVLALLVLLALVAFSWYALNYGTMMR